MDAPINATKIVHANRTTALDRTFRVRPTASVKVDIDSAGVLRRVLVRDLAPVRVEDREVAQ